MLEGRRWLAGTAAAVVALVAGNAVGLATVDEEPSPGAVLDEARAFVERETRFRFVARITVESRDEGAPRGRPGPSLVQRLELRGVASVPDRARFEVADGSSVTEVLVVGPRTWTRTAEERGDLGAERWAEPPADDTDDRDGVVRPGVQQDPRDVGEPQDLLRLLRAARQPTRNGTRDDGRPIVRAAVDPTAAFGAAIAEDVDEAVVHVSAGPRGVLGELTLTVRGPTLDVDASYRFEDWGDDVRIAAPAPQEIDPTPTIDEEAVGGFTAAPLLQPRTIPEGWSLVGAGVLPADETAEECEQVSLDFESADAETGYLYLFLVPADCPGLEAAPAGARPFTAGRNRGFVVVDGPSTYAQITVGRTIVQADTDLRPEDLARVLAALVPLDLAKPPAATLPGVSGRDRTA